MPLRVVAGNPWTPVDDGTKSGTADASRGFRGFRSRTDAEHRLTEV